MKKQGLKGVLAACGPKGCETRYRVWALCRQGPSKHLVGSSSIWKSRAKSKAAMKTMCRETIMKPR